MPIKIINQWITVVFSLLAVITFISLFLANFYLNAQIQTLFKQRESLDLAHKLSAGSDSLTNAVRAYAATGDANYEQAFIKEATVDKSRDNAVYGLRKLGATRQELGLIETAKHNSDNLINLETRAFEAGRAGDLELARNLVYGPTYLSEKERIMAPIQDFQKKIELRLLEEVKQAGWRANTSLVFAFFMVFTMVFVVVIGQVFFYSRRVVGPLVRLNEAVSQLTIQEKADELFRFDDGSEISVLAKSIKDFHQNAILASELQQFRLRIAEITVELYKAQDLTTLTQTAMNQISLFLDVHHGLLYVADEGGQCLNLMGGYGLPVDQVGRKVFFGEGLVGQCALSKAPIQMNNPPENYIKIASATGSAHPACLLMQPLLLNNHLLGIIELAAFRRFNDNDQMALAEISLALAMSIEVLSHKEI